jgi:peptidoglycan/LPS O-acetylase OafA/YrhL
MVLAWQDGDNVVITGTIAADKRTPSQFGLINLLKAGAAQLIVLHHLAFYGPMADHVRPMLPALIGWLGDSARIAVQAFLVIGGFLAAKSLAPTGHAGLADPIGAIWRRYAKLAPPFMVATLIAAAASMLAGKLMVHDSISGPATLSQLGAHALLLHGVLGFASLSAGAWYVAIDFQLYAVMALMLWIGGRIAAGRRLPWLMPAMIALAVTFSLVYFNLDADWDNWAPYFFGSYGLGLMAWWASDPRRKPGAAALLVGMAFLPVIAAQALDFRSRIALAMAVACLLVLFGRFPVCLLVNAAFTRFVPPEPELQAFGMLVAWGASLVAGAVFFSCVEAPLARLVQRTTGQTALRPSSA